MRVRGWQPGWVDIALLGVWLAVIVAFTCVYVSSERIFYWSDYSGYQNIAHDIVSRARASPIAAALAVARSMLQDYNALFTLPILPMLLLFGESRLVFELALALAFVFPFTVIAALVAVQLIPGPPRAVFFLAGSLALLTPATWAPALRGYPDAGAAALIALAVLVTVAGGEPRDIRRMPLVGALLAAAMLFRRHFAFAALAFLAAMVCLALIRLALAARHQPRSGLRGLLADGLSIGLAAGSMAAVLLTIGLPFVYHVAAQDVAALYASYEQPLGRLVVWYAQIYGWLICAAAAAGFIVGLAAQTVRREPAAFVLLFVAILFGVWALYVRELGDHYSLHFTLAIILGLVILAWTIWNKTGPTHRRAAAGLGGLLLMANAAVGLTPFELGATPGSGDLWAGKAAPLRRPDYDAVARLIGYLRASTPGGEPVYVAASSDILNKDLVINAERILYGWDAARLRVLQSPHIDSRDFYPLETLLQAQWVVMVEPFQHHLDPQQQRVLQVVYDLFTQDQEFAQDFEHRPETFIFDRGAVAHVFRRIRPTPLATAIRTLQIIQDYVPVRPGGQLAWISLSPGAAAVITQNRDGTYQVQASAAFPAGEDLRLLYLGAEAGTYAVAGSLMLDDEGCPGATVSLESVDGGGEITPLASAALDAETAPEFSLTGSHPAERYLSLRLARVPGGPGLQPCRLTIDQLRTTAK